MTFHYQRFFFLIQFFCVLGWTASINQEKKEFDVPLLHKISSAAPKFDHPELSSPKTVHQDNSFYNDRSSEILGAEDNASNKNNFPDIINIKSESPTTIIPILTTEVDSYLPMNISNTNQRNDFERVLTAHSKRSVKEIDDVSLIPAGSNTRIQVKKGPNGKDYEYEYVYYYYDEDENEGKPSTSETITKSITHSPIPESYSRRNNNKHKFEKTTIEPVINEIIPGINDNRARQLENNYQEISNERMPSTRFPPRTRGTNASEVIEPANRPRVNRQKVSSDNLNPSHYQSHQESPEFPQNLPNGPVRFLGVTPNESNEEKTVVLNRNNQNIAKIIPVEENHEKQYNTADIRVKDSYLSTFEKLHNSNVTSHIEPFNSETTAENESSTAYNQMKMIENSIIQLPQIMDKVALDLYAFSQRGRSNFIDFIPDSEAVEESTDFKSVGNIEITESSFNVTETPTSTSNYLNVSSSSKMIHTNFTTQHSIPSSSTIKSDLSTEDQNNVGLNFSRNTFRRPGSSISIQKNRLKSGNTSTATSKIDTISKEISTTATPTVKARGRTNRINFGGGEIKRSRLSTPKYQTVSSTEENVKDHEEKLNTEPKFGTGRGRTRILTARIGSHLKPTSIPINDNKTSTTTITPENSSFFNRLHRPTGINKISGISKRRGNRLGVSNTFPETKNEDGTAVEESAQSHETNPGDEYHLVTKSPIASTRSKPLNKPILKPSRGKLNSRSRPLLSHTTTEVSVSPAVIASETAIDEPASEGTEEETREALVDSTTAKRITTANSLNKLLQRHKIQIQTRSTTAKNFITASPRKSNLLPRRKVFETINDTDLIPKSTNDSTDGSSTISFDQIQLQAIVNNTTPSTKPEESKSLSSLLTLRRKVPSKKLGQIVNSPSD